MIETWLPVPEFEGYYEISDRGRVFSLRNYLILSTPPDGVGYPQVNLWVRGKQRHATVHLLVLTAFAGPCPPWQEARHLNDVKTDNRWPENLVWGTGQENQGIDRLANGLSNRGERHGMHKLTETEVLEIYARAQGGEPIGQIALAYGRSRQCIAHIARGRRWGWLTGELSSQAREAEVPGQAREDPDVGGG